MAEETAGEKRVREMMEGEQTADRDYTDPTKPPIGSDLKIEAVIVCVNYGDFLEHTLPENMAQLDRIVVVTTAKDWKTHKMCKRYGVTVLDSEVMYDQGDKFNKGRAINLGLSHMRHDGWLLHLDKLRSERSDTSLRNSRSQLGPKNSGTTLRWVVISRLNSFPATRKQSRQLKRP